MLVKKIVWIREKINPKNFLLFCSILVGLFAGIVAVILKRLVLFIENLFHSGITESYTHLLFFIYPVIGILLTVLYTRVFHKGKLGRGVSNIIYSIARRSGKVEKDKMYSHVISSAITVGFGGSAGLEAPIVVTGSAIGSNTATYLGLNGKDRILLLACGAAAGIAAVFNAPIAGMIFAIEVLLSEITIPAFIPLLIATATASVVSNLLYSERLFFLITNGWHMSAIPYYVVLGIVLGLLSVYVTRMLESTEEFFNKKRSVYGKAIVGGLSLGTLLFIIPPLYGEGYETIKELLNGNYAGILELSLFSNKSNDPWFILMLATGMVLVKVFATGITLGVGGSGGIFAPSLFIGASAGFVYSRFITLTGLTTLVTPNFIVAGMAGAISGIIYAPLTGVFLIAEITGGYSLFIPLMVVSAFSFFISRFFEPHSIYTRQLIRKGALATNKDQAVLHTINLDEMIENDFAVLNKGDNLKKLVESVTQSKRNIFVVTDDKKKLEGIVLLDDIREIMFNQELYETVRVSEIMSLPPAVVGKKEDLSSVIKKFDDTNSWNLPVVDNSGFYVGFISKSKIFSRYREQLLKQSEESL